MERKKIIISEAQYKRLFKPVNLITEDKEGKNMKKARNVVKQLQPSSDPMQIITAIRNDIPNSRINQCQYLPGVTRMYLQGQIQDGQTIAKLNQTLKILGTAHADEYNNDLNSMSAQELIQQFQGAVAADTEAAKQANAGRTFTQNNDYKIVKIPDYETASQYARYTSWCVTHYDSMYENYTHGGLGIFYFLLKNGFEQVIPEPGENCPLDEYGLSMVAVSINPDGSLNTVTCRWNHDNGGDDNIMSDEQVSQLIGQDIYKACPPKESKVLGQTQNFEVLEVEGKRILWGKHSNEPIPEGQELNSIMQYNDMEALKLYFPDAQNIGFTSNFKVIFAGGKVYFYSKWGNGEKKDTDAIEDMFLSDDRKGFQLLAPYLKDKNENERFRVMIFNNHNVILDKKNGICLDVDPDGCATFGGYGGENKGKVDENGNIVIPPHFFGVGRFDVDGYAVCDAYGCCLINKEGEQVYQAGAKGDHLGITMCNHAGTRRVFDDDYVAYINLNLGKKIDTETLEHIGMPGEYDNMIWTHDYQGKEYLYNANTLELAVNPNLYEEIDQYDEEDGRRKFYRGDLVGLFDKDFSILLQPIYKYIQSYNLGSHNRRVCKMVGDQKLRGRFNEDTYTITWDNGTTEQIKKQQPQVQESLIREDVEDEGITLTSTGTKQHPVMNMRFNTSRSDNDNAVVNNPQYGKNQVNMDTRMSNYPSSVINGKENGNSNIENILYYGYGYRIMVRVKIFAQCKGRRPFNMYRDEERWTDNPQMTPRVLSMLKRLKTRAENMIEQTKQTGNYRGLYDWANKWGMDKDNDNYRAQNLYNRAQNRQDAEFGNGRMPTYQIGLVPGTRVKVISLFKFNDFNISDALKNGTMRPSKQITGYIGNVANTSNKIPVTYDDNVPADIYNNFSKDEEGTYDGVDHFKKSYGLSDKNYTTATKFMDKSIMYAAYALKKEKYSPDFIVAAPSSSKFNPLYATALANKLGTAKFIDGFFQRNLINFTDEQGQVISEKMRKDGVDERLIGQFNSTMRGVAMEEMAAAVAAPIRKLVSDYYQIFADISTAPHSREKVNAKTIERLLASYFYDYMIRDMKTLQNTGEVGKYLLEKFNSSDKYIYGTDKYIAEEIRKRIKLKVGKRVFVQVLNQMWQIVQLLDKQLQGQGYKLIFTQKFKITELSRKLRGYLTNIYVVADKNFNENRELFKSYQQGKFLIIDDDVNSGASLKSTVLALDDVVPDENPDKLMCLVNAYYGSGF